MDKFLSIIVVSILLVSCNKAVLTDLRAGNSELLGKWRLDKAVTEGDTDVPDEEEEPDESEMFITFFPDGKVTTTFVFGDEDEETITSEGTYNCRRIRNSLR